MKTDGRAQCCIDLQRWLRASKMSLNEGKNKTGLNVDGDGSVGWGQGDSETQREVTTADEKVEDE